MRATPVIHEADFRLLTPQVSKVPRTHVQKDAVLQTVSLKPQGNTVSVTTLSDNPFEGGRPISVRTQQSGGMARPDQSQMSRSLLHSYMPGLGADSVPAVQASAAKPAGALDFLATAAGTAASVYQQQQAIKLAEAQAKIAQQNAIAAQWSNPLNAMQQRSSITVPLLIVAGGALLTAGAIWLSRRGKKSRRR
jgi:hypothetical protein